MSTSGRLNFKSFLLCLALASVLNLLPGLHVEQESPSESKAGSGEVHPESSPEAAVGTNLVVALRYVLQTYILFDEDGSGFIDR